MTSLPRHLLLVVSILSLCVGVWVVGYLYHFTRDVSSAGTVANSAVASSSTVATEVPVETATSTFTPVLTESPSEPTLDPDPVEAETPPVQAISVVTPPIMSAPSTPTLPQNTTEPSVRTSSPTWKEAIATVFWVGEGETADNSYIHNRASAWDEDWVGTFGGVDDPDKRCGYAPCGFTPQQSPFYVALPYLEYTYDGYKKNARDIPWYTKDALEADTLVHGHWVAVQRGTTVCYGQWRDTGPYETDDFAYVFGSATTPRNKVGVSAGIDLSPAMRDCLGVGDVSTVEWRFVDESEVPRGPWQS